MERGILDQRQEDRIWEVSTKLDFTLSELSLAGDRSKLHRILMLTASLPDVRDVVIIGPDDRVLERVERERVGESRREAFLLDLDGLFDEARRTGRTQFRHGKIKGKPFAYSVIPVQGGVFGDGLGFGVVLIDTSESDRRFGSILKRQLILAILQVVVLVGVFLWIMHGRVVKPLARIERTARASLGRGSYDSTRGLASRELRDLDRTLADTFNQLARVRRDLESRTEDLERHNQAMRDFTHIASHDLKEPLRKIRMFADRIDRKHRDELPEPALRDFERMSDAADRLQNLIQDIMDYTKLTSVEDQFDAVDLDGLFSEIVDDLSLLINETEATVEFSGLGVVHGSRVLLKQLFQNLVGNALKYRREAVAPVIRVTRSGAAGGVEIVVADNGIGFDQQYAEKIFGVFERLHGRGTFEGTGIGLAICSRIAQLHGGSIRAEGVEDKGSTFIVTLKVVSADDTDGS